MEEKYFNEFLIKSIEKNHNSTDFLRKIKLGEALVVSGLSRMKMKSLNLIFQQLEELKRVLKQGQPL